MTTSVQFLSSSLVILPFYAIYTEQAVTHKRRNMMFHLLLESILLEFDLYLGDMCLSSYSVAVSTLKSRFTGGLAVYISVFAEEELKPYDF
jgi:hypothetical protein